MTVPPRDPVLRRKVTPPAPPTAPIAVALSGPAQGLGRAFARAVTSAVALVVEGSATARRTVSQSELLDSIDTDAFVALLSAGDDGPALAVLDQSGFSAMIEAMTIGRLGPRAPVARRPTTTDASLLAEVLDKTLAALAEADLETLHFDRPVADHRLLAVLLDDVQFDLITLDAHLVSGAEDREVQLMLAIPKPDEKPDVVAGDSASTQTHSDWSQALEASVLRAPASLRAELGRLTLPLAQVLTLGVGGALTLPLSNLEEVQLVALDGSVQAMGRLGQSRGMRAVRLTSWPNGHPPEPKMTEMMSAHSGLQTGLMPVVPLTRSAITEGGG